MRLIYMFVLLVFFASSCNSDVVTQQPKVQKRSIEDSLMRANQFLLKRDSELIQSYVDRHHMKMNISPDGLWYQIVKKTNGKKLKKGDYVRYNYRIGLLDGTLCYSSEKDGNRQIKIGSSGKENGLEKGFLMMHAGESAKFILPPYLAYGLVGDMKKIPARSALIYDIEILEVTDF